MPADPPPANPTHVWRSHDIVFRAGTPQATLASDRGSELHARAFESEGPDDVARRAPYGSFVVTPVPGIASWVGADRWWSVKGTENDWDFGLVGRSLVGRGLESGEGNPPLPTGDGIRDIVMHPPQRGGQVVLAFAVPFSGDFSLSAVAARRTKALGESARLKIYGPNGVERVRVVVGTVETGTAWKKADTGGPSFAMRAGEEIFFAVDRGQENEFAWDAVEVVFTLTGTQR